MAARYLKAYIEKIEKSENTQKNQTNPLNYIITVMGNVRKKVAMACGYERIHVLTGEESQCLCRAVVFLGYEKSRGEILQHRFAYTNKLWKLGNYKGINFDDHFRYSIFGLSKDAKPVVPDGAGLFGREEKETETGKDNLNGGSEKDNLNGGLETEKLRDLRERALEFIKDNGLVRGKTVIISPFANTIANPSKEFWIKIVEGLKKKGYVPVTNSGGDLEPAIEGTKPVLIPFDITIPVVELCGAFIGLRSGLCDFIACADAKKVIIYPDRIYVNGPVIDFYSLNKMGLCSDALEYVYNEKEPEKTVEEVVEGVVV